MRKRRRRRRLSFRLVRLRCILSLPLPPSCSPLIPSPFYRRIFAMPALCVLSLGARPR